MGLICTQLLPSHSHVSPRKTDPDPPPNSTVRWRAESYTIPWARRAEGERVGFIFVHFLPSHSHVSPTGVPECPPNNTVRWRTESYAIAELWRAEGEVVGLICVQLLRSHSQVSAKRFAPPNNTTR